MVATHDVEFVAAAADRVVVLADGEVVADGPTADVVGRLAGLRARRSPRSSRRSAWLTVDEVGDRAVDEPAVTAVAG